MKISRLRALRGLALGIVVALTGSLAAQTLNWTSGSGNVLTNSANWGGTAPNSTHTLTFNNVTSGNANVTLAGGSLSINSMAFNNTAMRVSAALGTNLGNGVITFNNAITLITASNSANVNFTSVNTTTTNATVPTLTINLNYTGFGTINTVDAASTVSAWNYTNGTAANFTGGGGLIKTGLGTLRLGNYHTYSGGFDLQQGLVEVMQNATASTSPFGTGTLTLSGGTLSSNSTATRTFFNPTRLNGVVTIGNSGTGNITFNNSTAAAAQLLANSTLTTVVNVTWQQPISGEFALTKNGSAELTFGTSASASTYSGGFELKEGMVTLSSSGNSNVSNAQSAFGTGTLRLSGGTVVSSNTSAGGDRFIYNPVVFNGTVTLGDAASLAGLTISTGWGNSATVASDSTIHTPGATIVINQEISGSANLTKTGAGTLTISDSNPNFTGNLYILGGVLSVDAPGNLGANSLSRTTIIDNATLRFTGTTASGNARTYSLGENGGTFDVTSSSVSINAEIMDYNGQAGRLIKTGSGTLTLNATNSYTGGTTVSAGTLAVSSATIPGDITNNAAVIFNQTSNGTYSGNITGTGSLTKTGTGVLTLTNHGLNYSGGTTVSAGGLRVEGTLSGPVTIEAAAELSGSGTLGGAVTIAGTHSPGSSPGIQSFGDNLTYQADATVNWELSANTATQGDPTAVYDQINVTGTLDFAGATSLALSFNGAGSGVNWNDAFWDANRSWKIYDTASVSNFGNLSLVTSDWADGSGNLFDTVLAGAGFSLSQAGNDIFLNYAAAPIPEPATAAALLGAAILALALQRRRRGQRP